MCSSVRDCRAAGRFQYANQGGGNYTEEGKSINVHIAAVPGCLRISLELSLATG